MRVRVKPYWLPKAGNTQGEYEDAFYPKLRERRGKQLHFAVADGASESMLSGKWAEILVKKFCKLRAVRADFLDFLEITYKAWGSLQTNYLDERQKSDQPIEWYEEMGFRAGAFSTFLGFTLIDFEKKSYGGWKAVAVGDSCLLQVRGESLIERFPIQHSFDFNNRPWLISSNPTKNNKVPELLKTTMGDWKLGDKFFLMTDSLACWFLQKNEAGQNPQSIISDLDAFDRNQSFEDWICELRTRKQIHNDDVTLIHIDIIP